MNIVKGYIHTKITKFVNNGLVNKNYAKYNKINTELWVIISNRRRIMYMIKGKY